MPVIRKRLAQIRAEDSSLWLLPYCALMMVLLVFFAGMYAYSNMSSFASESAFADLSETLVPKKEIKLAQAMNEYIEKNLADIVKMEVSARYIRFELRSPALFDSGKAELKPHILPLFEKMAEQMQEMGNTVIVEGHTDNIPINGGSYNSNWELSAARAFSVIYYFIGKGLSPDRLVAHGYGEFRPLASNDTEKGRAKNRRIEITILRGA